MMVILFTVIALFSPAVVKACEEVYTSRENEGIVDDAFSRFSGGNQNARRGYYAVVINMEPNVCVSLQPKPRTFGPSPTYCYDMNGAFVASYGVDH